MISDNLAAEYTASDYFTTGNRHNDKILGLTKAYTHYIHIIVSGVGQYEAAHEAHETPWLSGPWLQQGFRPRHYFATPNVTHLPANPNSRRVKSNYKARANHSRGAFILQTHYCLPRATNSQIAISTMISSMAAAFQGASHAPSNPTVSRNRLPGCVRAF